MKYLLATINLSMSVIIIVVLSRFYNIEWWITTLTILLYNAVLLAWKQEDLKSK